MSLDCLYWLISRLVDLDSSCYCSDSGRFHCLIDGVAIDCADYVVCRKGQCLDLSGSDLCLEGWNCPGCPGLRGLRTRRLRDLKCRPCR